MVSNRPSRRRLKPEERRRELLEAGIRLLRDRDVDDVRVDDVTTAAGAAKGTFYLYFGSWKDLLVAVRDHYLSGHADQVRQRLRSTPAGPAAAWAAFEEECLRFVDLLTSLGDLHKALFHGPIAGRPMDPASSGEAVAADALRMVIATGACREVDAGTAAALLFAALRATADGIMASGQRERRLATLTGMLRSWLSVPGLLTPAGDETAAGDEAPVGDHPLKGGGSLP